MTSCVREWAGGWVGGWDVSVCVCVCTRTRCVQCVHVSRKMKEIKYMYIYTKYANTCVCVCAYMYESTNFCIASFPGLSLTFSSCLAQTALDCCHLDLGLRI